MTGGISTRGRGVGRFECGTRLVSCEKEEIFSQMRNGEGRGGRGWNRVNREGTRNGRGT